MERVLRTVVPGAKKKYGGGAEGGDAEVGEGGRGPGSGRDGGGGGVRGWVWWEGGLGCS